MNTLLSPAVSTHMQAAVLVPTQKYIKNRKPKDYRSFHKQKRQVSQLPTAPKDRPFNGFGTTLSAKAAVVVFHVMHEVQNYERHRGIRKKKRRPDDQRRFERQIEALVCDVALREIDRPRGWLAIPFASEILGRKDRYRSEVFTETLRKVVEAMATPEMGLIEFIKGHRNPFDPSLSRQTVIRASDTLRNRIKVYGLTRADFGLEGTEETIILKDSKDEHEDTGKRMQYVDTFQTNQYRNDLGRINDWLEAADIEYVRQGAEDWHVDDSARRLRRYFNNGSFEEGGRLFGGFWQPLSKQQRAAGILINGQPVVALDYGQMTPRILYGRAGIDPHFTDAYAVPGLEGYRDGVKKVFNAMLHSEKPFGRKPSGTSALLPKDRPISEITVMIQEFHGPVERAFYAGKGLYLSYLESFILVKVMLELVDQGITALPIHDAVLVAEDDEEHVKEAMLKIFKEFTGGDGIVRREESVEPP